MEDVFSRGFQNDAPPITDPGAPQIGLSIVKNVWIKQMYFEKIGDTMPGHRHNFDHATLLAAGSVEVTANGAVTAFRAPRMIWIKADVEHTIKATRPHTVCYCVHAIRDGDGVEDIIDPDSVPDGTKSLSLIAGAKPLIK